MLAQRGSKSGNIILEGSNLIMGPKHSLYMSFMNCGSRDQTIILQYTKLYIEIVEAKNIFGQALRYW